MNQTNKTERDYALNSPKLFKRSLNIFIQRPPFMMGRVYLLLLLSGGAKTGGAAVNHPPFPIIKLNQVKGRPLIERYHRMRIPLSLITYIHHVPILNGTRQVQNLQRVINSKVSRMRPN